MNKYSSKDFDILQLFDKVNNLIRKLEIEEFKLINSELLALLGKSLNISNINIFGFKNLKDPHLCNLVACWNDDSFNEITEIKKEDFIIFGNEFIKKFNTLDYFNIDDIDFEFINSSNLFFKLLNNHLCMPIKNADGFTGFFIFSTHVPFNLGSIEVNFLRIFSNNFGEFVANNLNNNYSIKKGLPIHPNGFYESILNAIPAYISVLDTSQNYIYLSKSAVKDNALREWLIGKNDFDYCDYRNKPISIAEKRSKLFKTVLSTKKASSIEEYYTNKNGENHVELRMMTPVFEDNVLQYVIVYGIDITEIKNKELEMSKQYLALEHSPVGIALLNNEGNYTYSNSYHAKLFGYEVEEMIGKPWGILYNDDEVSKISTKYFPELMANGIWKGETKGKKKNGEPIFQDIVLTTFEDGGLACMTRDITSIKAELNRIKLMNDQFELALNSANLGMTQFNLNSREIVFHETFLRLIGYQADEITDLSLNNWFSYVHPDDRAYMINDMQNYIASYFVKPVDEIFRREYRLIHKKGHFIWVLGAGKIINHDSYGPVMTGFNIDITSIKEAENDLKNALEKEKQLHELKSRFVTMASHEFRTPLSTIRLGIEIIKKLFDNNDGQNISIPRVYKKLDDILVDVDRMNDLMSEILTMGKIDANRINVNLEKVDLNEFLFNYVIERKSRDINNKNIQLELTENKCLALLDVKLINQIFNNLIGNAIKYSDDSSNIIVRSKINQEQILVEVEDFGFGISEDDLPHIFDSFYRSKAVENIEGTGLGMSIVKLFVERNNGQIYVESKLNVGTKVTLIFNRIS